MTFLQYVTIALGFLMNMLDGMDVLVISFAAPSISNEWGIPPEALGLVFSAALLGMMLGALFIAPLADRIGRKRIIFFCALTMGLGVTVTAYTYAVEQLMILRFISGLGIGGMLATVPTLVSEFSPDKTRSFWVGFVMGGYPIGATLTGLVASYIIPEFGWRTLFKVAGLFTLGTLPFIGLFLSESLDYLLKKQSKNALVKANDILSKLKALPLNELPDIVEQNKTSYRVKGLLTVHNWKSTILIWTAFFMSYITLYFLISWIPKLTTLAGMPERFGIYSGTLFNAGAFLGILVLGGLAIRLGIRKMILVFLLGTAALMAIFGWVTGSILTIIVFAALGFLIQGGFVALYPVATQLYPPEIRTTGVGWAIGIGRLGAVVGPLLAGYLVGAGFDMTTNFIIFAIPCVIAGLAAFLIRSDGIS